MVEDTDLIDHMVFLEGRLLRKLRGTQGVCSREAYEPFTFYQEDVIAVRDGHSRQGAFEGHVPGKMLSHNVIFPFRGPKPHRSKALVVLNLCKSRSYLVSGIPGANSCVEGLETIQDWPSCSRQIAPPSIQASQASSTRR